MPLWLIKTLLVIFLVVPLISAVVFAALAITAMQVREEEKRNAEA